MFQQSLLILVMIICSSVVLSSAQIITKVYPVNMSCNRNKTIREMERHESNMLTGREYL